MAKPLRGEVDVGRREREWLVKMMGELPKGMAQSYYHRSAAFYESRCAPTVTKRILEAAEAAYEKRFGSKP
jgi:hypothetical protein